MNLKNAVSIIRHPKENSNWRTKRENAKNAEGGLSASYNIGARYFIREILKPLPATERSLLEAKVPAVKSRTSCVYADLRDLISEMELRKAA
ncbi:hypothetical protein [Blautia sp. AM47-4]|uniref:hypothetical protein n=1 Tax=Blautia sp. AM47-4 TaxID=2292979 RepID=UPI001FA9E5CF|nr:hypothetical protein [Blautia sp. AM47-4]